MKTPVPLDKAGDQVPPVFAVVPKRVNKFKEGSLWQKVLLALTPALRLCTTFTVTVAEAPGQLAEPAKV